MPGRTIRNFLNEYSPIPYEDRTPAECREILEYWKRPTSLSSDQALANGITNQTGHVTQLQFLHHVSPMGFGGFDTNLQYACDLLNVFTFRNQLKDLALTTAYRLVVLRQIRVHNCF